MAFTEVLAVFFRRLRESVKKAEWSGGIESHQRIIDARKAGRVRAAVQELRTNIESHRERMQADSLNLTAAIIPIGSDNLKRDHS